MRKSIEYWEAQPYDELIKIYLSIKKAQEHGFTLLESDEIEFDLIQTMKNKIEKFNTTDRYIKI